MGHPLELLVSPAPIYIPYKSLETMVRENCFCRITLAVRFCLKTVFYLFIDIVFVLSFLLLLTFSKFWSSMKIGHPKLHLHYTNRDMWHVSCLRDMLTTPVWHWCYPIFKKFIIGLYVIYPAILEFFFIKRSTYNICLFVQIISKNNKRL